MGKSEAQLLQESNWKPIFWTMSTYKYTTESYAHNKNIKVFQLETLSARVLTYSATPTGFYCDNLLHN